MRVLAVDLGAASIRVAAVDLDATPPAVEILHRYAHAPLRASDGTLRWDWDRLLAEVTHGLDAGLAAGPVASVGVDTWGVDYGLIDARGARLSAPYCYRDDRTAGWRDVAERIGAERLYANTGIQLMAINTLFQLAAHDREELKAADRLLMLPELVVHHLTGTVTGERTSAGTTGLVDVRRGTWSEDLIAALDLPLSLFPSMAQPGTPAGTWRGVPVHLVAGHDTASAVVALPGRPQSRAAFVSTGTWLLVGAERPEPDTSAAARTANFSNEPGALGGVRFLKNVMGFWMLERCRERWGDVSVDELTAEAESAPPDGPVVDATDERFLAPDDMEAAIRATARLATAPRSIVVRCIFESLAAGVAGVIKELNVFLDGPVSEIHLLGGGARNPLFRRLIAERCDVDVRVGAVEAAALGNALVQGIALGRYADLNEARSTLNA